MIGRRLIVLGTFVALFAFQPAVAMAASPTPSATVKPTPTPTPSRTPTPTPSRTPTPTPSRTPTPSPSHTPTPSPSLIPTPTPTSAPTPTPTPAATPQGQISINPSAAPAATTVLLTGSGLPPNRTFGVLWDGSHVADVPTDAGGGMSANFQIPDNARGAFHLICLQEDAATVCANFTLQAQAPSQVTTAAAVVAPSPSPGPSHSPSPTPLATRAPVTTGGTSPVAFLAKPPLVFVPIILVILLITGLVSWLWRMRPTPALGEVTVLHKAAPPRRYEPPDRSGPHD